MGVSYVRQITHILKNGKKIHIFRFRGGTNEHEVWLNIPSRVSGDVVILSRARSCSCSYRVGRQSPASAKCTGRKFSLALQPSPFNFYAAISVAQTIKPSLLYRSFARWFKVRESWPKSFDTKFFGGDILDFSKRSVLFAYSRSIGFKKCLGLGFIIAHKEH